MVIAGVGAHHHQESCRAELDGELIPSAKAGFQTCPMLARVSGELCVSDTARGALQGWEVSVKYKKRAGSKHMVLDFPGFCSSGSEIYGT